MKKYMLAAVILGCVMSLPQQAGAANADVTVTLPLNTIAVTNLITVPAGMAVDHLVINNEAAFSNTVAVAIYDANVVGATLYSGALAAATGSAYTYPLRAAAYGSQTQDFYTVKTVRCIVTSTSGATNTTTGPVKILIQGRPAPIVQ